MLQLPTELEAVRDPDIHIEGLRIWVVDRGDHGSLDVVAHCSAKGASVCVSGWILEDRELRELMAGCEALYRDLKGRFDLECLEPELAFSVEGGRLGQFDFEVRITPDLMHQSHKFVYSIDQTHLGALIEGCKRLLKLDH